jgi:hypothetical protein
MAQLACLTGLPVRKLRYVFDHRLLPGMRPGSSGHGVSRTFTDFEGFSIALAALLLDSGFSRKLVAATFVAACRPFGSSRNATEVPLFRAYTLAAGRVEIGDARYLRIQSPPLPGDRRPLGHRLGAVELLPSGPGRVCPHGTRNRRTRRSGQSHPRSDIQEAAERDEFFSLVTHPSSLEVRMIPNISPEVLRDHPPELVRFAEDEAARDADDVIALLTAAGLAPSEGQSRNFPPGILLDLGAYVRLRRWEAAGVNVHREAGLPSAAEAMTRIIDALDVAAQNPASLGSAGSLARTVVDLAVTQWVWTARPELGADLVLAPTDEDALIEAMARFLWEHRHVSFATSARTES